MSMLARQNKNLTGDAISKDGGDLAPSGISRTGAGLPASDNTAIRYTIPTAILISPPTPVFLSAKVTAGTISKADLEAVADLLVQYHFNHLICPMVFTKLAEVLQKKVVEEARKAVVECISKADVKNRLVNDWFDRMLGYIILKTECITAAAIGLLEPIQGFGDLRLNNIASLSEGRVAFLNIDPTGDDFVRTRRMDGGLIRAELLMLRRKDDADTYWNAYEQAYQKKLATLNQFYPADSVIAKGVLAIDIIGQFHQFRKAYCSAISKRDLVAAKTAEDLISTLLNDLP